jgi:hypothetical protein
MRALAADPTRRIPTMEALGAELSAWLDTAAAAGWGEEPLPGFRREDLDQPTVTRAKDRDEGDPALRLGPYLDALRTGGVGSRRAAAERLLATVQPADENYLLDQLASAPDGARFALVQTLGRIGTEASLEAVLSLLQDPFARGEAAEAVSLIGLRAGIPVLDRLQESGLGSPWRWVARARLDDAAWAEALARDWEGLSTPLRLQALEAARLLPEARREAVKAATAEASRLGGNLRQAWEAL